MISTDRARRRWDKPGHDGVFISHRSHGSVVTRARVKFFIIFVDGIFTTSFQRLFTKAFDVILQSAAIACVYRAGNAD